jgi:deoxyribodipyrimidine photo-lyase
MIQRERIQVLKDAGENDGRYVLYWMQQSQRAECNHALEYAVQEANRRTLPLVVAFGLTDAYPEANARHYAFLLEGLKDVNRGLRRRRIRFVVRHGPPEGSVGRLARDAAMLVMDRGYLRVQKSWRERVAEDTPCTVVQVEGDVVVPVDTTSDREEYAARTIRPKINRLLGEYLVPLKTTPVKVPSLDMAFESLDVEDVDGLLSRLEIDQSVSPVRDYRGGTGRAKRLLARFVERALPGYGEHRRDPSLNGTSHLSPYLHFGQISPLTIALRVAGADAGEDGDAFLEELIVRRELSMNFVHRNPAYDRYEALPEWTRRTLNRHRGDPREHRYDLARLEAGDTHDSFWNAAQKEMVLTGHMHNTMRMYWGKKILEWSETPEEAFHAALSLNNKYELDGRDANSYAGVAWCFGKHDRPWKERAGFGTVRYMNEAGLRRKFDMEGYLRRVEGVA